MRTVGRLSGSLALVAAAATGLAPAEDTTDRPRVTSLLGRPLPPPALPDSFRETQLGLLAEASARLAERPDDPEAWIWVGRRTAYLGRYAEAIEIYSRAIERFPEDARFLRHRGHRHISVRRLDAAIADLEGAARLVQGKPDVVEPDGLPNARGIPTSTLQTNIWYHLGLALYLKGDFEAAIPAYERCLELSKNPDMLAATSHWLYMTLRRLGRDQAARAILEPISAEMEIIENHDYHRLLLMYRGQREPDALLSEAAARPGANAFPTTAYGVANWFLYNGDGKRAAALFRRIVESDAWAAFGYIAAEAELAGASGR